MFNARRLSICLLSSFSLSTSLFAQEQRNTAGAKSSPAITASTVREKVRFSSLAGATQLRVQIISPAGDTIFDSSWKDGNVLDWPMESPGQPLANGSYRCVVTVKDIEGQVTQKEANLKAQGGQVSIEQRGDADGLTVHGADGIGPKITLLAHDGVNGSVVSTSGDLSFRFGDFLAAKDNERMRLTAEGNLGIGTGNPLATLDVNGLIRTSKGIMFADGTILTTAAGGQAVIDEGGLVRRHASSPGTAKNGGNEPRQSANPRVPLVPPRTAPEPEKPAASLIPRTNAGPAYQFRTLATGLQVGAPGSLPYRLDATGDVNTGTQFDIGGSRVLLCTPNTSSTAYENTYLGLQAGSNDTGSRNSFIGALAGVSNAAGANNTFVGAEAGIHSQSANDNVALGMQAGLNLSTGFGNTFIGSSAGTNTGAENGNTFLGYKANAVSYLANVTAIGAVAYATQNNTVVLGSIAGVNGAGATASVGIATSTPNQYLSVGGGITVDANGTNNGSVSNSVLAFGAAPSNGISGEAIASQRGATGGNQYGLDFYTLFAKRMSISNSGNVSVYGTLSKGAGSFKIDHPLDPENKYLYHSFVESPDMMNIYNGNVVLDDRGEAVVQLPDWFEALNQDFRYQVTCLHGYAPVYIDEEIDGNQFKIAGGKPGLKVSWQVTGVRHDAFANAHRIRVEEDKPAGERGTLLYPAAQR